MNYKKYLSLMTFIILQVMVNILIAGPADNNKEKKNSEKSVSIELSDQAAFVVMGKKVTLGEAIIMVLERNQDTLTGSYDVAMTDSMYQKYQKKYSPFLNLEAGRKYQEFPEDMGSLVGKDQTTWDMTAAVAKMFETGTTLAAGLKHERTVINKDPLLFPIPNADPMVIPADAFGDVDYHRPIMFVSVRQELLKNSFGYGERRLREILKNAGKMQKEILIYKLSGLIVSTVVDYWTVIMRVSSLENAVLQLRETKRVRNIIAQNVRFGLSEGFELNFYNTMVAGAEARMMNSRQQYRDALRKLLRTLNLDSGISVSDTAVLSNVLPEINQEEALKEAFDRRADYISARLNLKNCKMELEMYGNEGLPSVTAELNLSTMAQRDRASDAYSDATSIKYPAWEARVRVTYPLDDQEQKVNERNARFKLEQARLQMEKYSRVVRDDVVSNIERINTYYNLYRKTMEARGQAETYYWKLLNSLRRGRFSAAVVKNGLDAMIASRQSELEALVLYNITLLQFDVAKNSLFDRYKIDVNKYIPK